MAPDEPTVPRWSVEVMTGGCTREHDKCVEVKSSAPDDPTSTGALRRSNDVIAQVQIPSVPDEPMLTG